MRFIATGRLRLRSILRRADVDRELDDELNFYLDERTRHHVASGLGAREARLAARRDLGSVAQIQQEVRDTRRVQRLEEVVQDARYAWRSFGRYPGFTAVAILTLALGIGATTAIFSVVRGVLLQPLPYPSADRMVQIIENVPAAESITGRAVRLAAMNQNEFDWRRRHTRTLSQMAALIPVTRTMMTPEGTVRLAGQRVSPALFAIRDVRPIIGRWLRLDEERRDANVVVLGAATWQRYFGSDPDVIHHTVVLDGQVSAVVGVMPAAFGDDAFWTPFVVEPPRPGGVTLVTVASRLQDGASLQAAAAEANVLGYQFRGTQPELGRSPRFEVVREQEQMLAAVRPALRVLVAAVGAVLLIVCANLANLLLVRGAGRQREIGVRLALGAPRSRIVRQLLTENFALALTGGLAGAALVYGAVRLLRTLGVIDIPDRFRNALAPLGPTILPRVNEIAVDPTVLAFAFGLSLVTGVVFGLAPAMRLSRIDHRQAFDTGNLTSQSGDSRRRTRVGHVLAVIQLGLATTLLVGTGLLTHSFLNLSSLALGFDPSAQIFQLVSPGEYSRARRLALAQDVSTRLRRLPGIEAAGFINLPPLLALRGMTNVYLPVEREAERDALGDDDASVILGVSPDYLRALGVRLLEGRWLGERDGDAGQTRVVLVNRAWAARFSPDKSPVGRRVAMVSRGRARQRVTSEIIGVVEDVRWRTNDGPASQPREQLPLAVVMDLRRLLADFSNGDLERASPELDMFIGEPGGLSFAVRSKGDPLTFAALRGVAREADPAMAVEGVTTMGHVFSALIGRQRFYAVLVGVFGAIAAVVAAIGIYGVLAYAMTQRTHEFGIRLALGAQRAAVQGLALRQGLVLVAIGVAGGLAGAIGLTRYLSGMLFGLTPLDPLTYATVATLFAAVAMLASLVPARRASRVDPLIALRHE